MNYRYFNSRTKGVVTIRQDQYDSLPDEEKRHCRPYKPEHRAVIQGGCKSGKCRAPQPTNALPPVFMPTAEKVEYETKVIKTFWYHLFRFFMIYGWWIPLINIRHKVLIISIVKVKGSKDENIKTVTGADIIHIWTPLEDLMDMPRSERRKLKV